MRKGNTSGVLSSHVGREYREKFDKIHAFYNNMDEFHYLPKIAVMKMLLDNEYKRLYE